MTVSELDKMRDAVEHNMAWSIITHQPSGTSWCVSTGWRESSAAISSPPWFAETIVWEWDGKNRGQILHTDGLNSYCLIVHSEVCEMLLSGGIKALEAEKEA